jgi:hypothetical protein
MPFVAIVELIFCFLAIFNSHLELVVVEVDEYNVVDNHD